MVVDEVMSAWRGAEGKYSAEGLPHVTKIARKPEGVGAEIKALADGESNIMLRLDIMEGKDRQREKPFADVGSEGTAITLRLSQPYFGSGRVIHADSAFSSVRTCLELRKQPALHGVCEDSNSRISQALLGILRRSIWTRPSATSRGLATAEIKCCTRRKSA